MFEWFASLVANLIEICHNVCVVLKKKKKVEKFNHMTNHTCVPSVAFVKINTLKTLTEWLCHATG